MLVFVVTYAVDEAVIANITKTEYWKEVWMYNSFLIGSWIMERVF
jgi:hypothetical protein